MERPKRAAVTELFAFDTATKKMKKTAVDERGFYSLSYRYNGKVSIKTENVEFVSEANSVTFMPHGIAYETEIIEDTKMAVVHFKLDRDIDFRNPALLRSVDKGTQILFEKTVQSFHVDEPLDFACMANFYELLAKLEAYTIFAKGEEAPRKIALAKENMLKSFTDPLFSVATLAESVGVSTAYLRRGFALAYGKSPIAFLRDLRISTAKNLLQSEYLTVEEIARQSGFSSASYFIQTFHKTVGISPDRYRERTYGK